MPQTSFDPPGIPLIGGQLKSLKAIFNISLGRKKPCKKKEIKINF